MPPIFIFNTSAEKLENQKIHTKWVEGLPKVSGRYGCPTTEEYSSHCAVRGKGGMDESLFQDYVYNVIVTLYPNVGPKVKMSPCGKLIEALVLIKTYVGPGRLNASLESIDFRKKCHDIDSHILLSLPSGTSISAEMDQLYRGFKCLTRASTQDIFNGKVYEETMLLK